MTGNHEPGATPAKAWPQPANGGGKERGEFAAGAAVIVLLVFAAYWPALRGQFVWDDTLLVNRNPLVSGQMNLRTVWFQTDFSLTLAALWLQWQVWGNHPAGYHAVNVLLHASGCLLLWRVLARLKIPGAWLAAAILAVHPVCATSVAWISEMKNTLSLPFYLLSVLWFLNFEGAQVPGRKAGATRWHWLSLAAFLLAMLAKTTTVMLPAVLLVCAWWQRGRMTRQDVWRVSPFFVLALLLGCLTVWFQAQAMAGGDPVQTGDFGGRLAGAGRALWFYLGKALWPLKLSLIYPRWEIDSTGPAAYAPAILWAGVLGLCGWFRRSWGRAALFGLGCYTVNLLPVLGFISMDYLAISRVSDHFQYLPLAALAALAAAGLRKLLPTRALIFAAAALVLSLSALTWQRARVIASGEMLWRDTLAKNPASWTAHNNLGCVLADQNKLDDAMEQFEVALKLCPKDASAHSNLGRALSLRGRFAEAENQFQAALKIKYADADTQQSYASALLEQGKKAEAIKPLREAVRLQPEPGLRLRLASLLYETGNFREAAAEYRRVLVRLPDSLEALNNAAWLLATCPDAAVRNGADAVRFAGRACRLTQYQNAGMVGTLAAADAEAGRFTEAVATAEKAVALSAAAGDTRFAAINQQLLALYRAGKPFHEPPPGTTNNSPP